MTAETITPNEDEITPCDNYGAISSREPCCDHGRQLDHLDTMLHDILQRLAKLDPLIPHLPRALALLDPGAAMRRSMRRGKNGV